MNISLKNACLFFLLSGVLVGCTTPEGIRRPEPLGTIQYSGVGSLLTSVRPIATIDQGAETRFHIDDLNSPNFLKEGKKQNFELVSIHGKQGQYFRVVIKSLCSCIGFKKKIMVPWTMLVDSSGKDIGGRPAISGPGVFERFFPAYIMVEYTGVFEADGDYTVFVSADLSAEAQERYRRVQMYINNGLVSGVAPFIFITRPYGEVVVKIE